MSTTLALILLSIAIVIFFLAWMWPRWSLISYQYHAENEHYTLVLLCRMGFWKLKCQANGKCKVWYWSSSGRRCTPSNDIVFNRFWYLLEQKDEGIKSLEQQEKGIDDG